MASSRKLGGRCVAGISTDSEEWLRPVSSMPGGLRHFHCRVEGRWPEPLDIVRFGYKERLEDPAQPENLLIDDADWELTGRLEPEDMYARFEGHLVHGPELLGNRGKAMPDHVAAEGVETSLVLVEPDRPVDFVMRPPEETQGKLKPRVLFDLGGVEYELGLTDIPLESRVREKGVGTYGTEELGLVEPSRTLLTISLGEVHDGWHTKLAAAVFLLP